MVNKAFGVGKIRLDSRYIAVVPICNIIKSIHESDQQGQTLCSCCDAQGIHKFICALHQKPSSSRCLHEEIIHLKNPNNP